MKQNINEYDFVRAFDDCGRSDNFSRMGRFALYEYLTDIEDDCGFEMELDPIAICCEFTEYENLDEFRECYSLNYETMESIEEETTVIYIGEYVTGATPDGTAGFIAQDF